MKIAGISYDLEEAPQSLELWFDRMDQIILSALENHDIVVLPELMHMSLSKYCVETDLKSQIKFCADVLWKKYIPELLPKLPHKEHFLVLGSGPFQLSEGVFTNRAPIIVNGKLNGFDKIYLTPWEGCFVRGTTVSLYQFKGLKIAPLICFDIEQPYISTLLKHERVDLLLVPSATSSRNGSQRILRTASGRSIELGCAVFVVPVIGTIDYNELVDKNEGRQGLFLPAQQCISHEQEQYSEYRTRVTDVCSFDLEVAEIKNVKENNGETKPFFTIDVPLNLEKL
ncbi:MAG: hypothetical protein ACOYL6_12655 [Bacteriovoracaceae bacterium]